MKPRRTLSPLDRPTPTVRRRSFPLSDVPVSTGRSPTLVVGVGGAGEEVVRQARRLPANPAVLFLAFNEIGVKTDTPARPASATPWAALDSLHREVVVVGEGNDLVHLWSQVAAILAAHCTGGEPTAIILELGRQTASLPPLCLPPPGRVLGPFRMADRYPHAVLSPEEVAALTARLLWRGLGRVLTRFAVARPIDGLVLVGGASAWLPEVSIGQALARYLLVRCAEYKDALPSPGGQPLPTVLTPGLTGQLHRQLADLVTAAIGRLSARLGGVLRKAPLPSLEPATEADSAALAAVDQAWREDCQSRFLLVLRRLLEHEGLARIRESVAQALRDLESAQVELSARAKALAARRSLLAERVRREDARRLNAWRCWCLWRPLCRWWRTRRTRRRLAEYGRVRREELCCRYRGLACQKLHARLRQLADRLCALADRAGAAGQDLVDMLTPQHPNLVPLHEVATLAQVLAGLAGPLVSASAGPATTEIWRLAARGILEPGPNEAPAWQALFEAAVAVAGRLPDAGQTFAAACRGLLPPSQVESKTTLLRQWAIPYPRAEVNGPEMNALVDFGGLEEGKYPHGNELGGLPALVGLRWRLRRK